MIFHETYTDIHLALELKEKGFDWPCRYMYADYTRVADEIIEKHPGLSDDGYMDLMKEYGGIYEREQVYKTYREPVERYCRNTPEFLNEEWRRMVCAMPTTAQVRTWLREVHRIDISVFPVSGGYKADVTIPDITDETGLGRISIRAAQPADNAEGITEEFNDYPQAERAAIALATAHVISK